MNDLISRQWAIDAINSYFVNPPEYMKGYTGRLLFAIKMDLLDYINSLPSVQQDWNEMIVICDCCGHAIHVKRQ